MNKGLATMALVTAISAATPHREPERPTTGTPRPCVKMSDGDNHYVAADSCPVKALMAQLDMTLHCLHIATTDGVFVEGESSMTSCRYLVNLEGELGKVVCICGYGEEEE